MVSASGCTEVDQEQLLFDDYRNLYLTSQGGVGMWLATSNALGVGAKLEKFSGWVKAIGTPEGTLYCRVYNQTSPPSTSATLETEATTTYDVSSISTSSYVEHEFTFDGTYTLQTGDFILLWYTQGSGGGYLSSMFELSDVYDSTDSVSGYHHSSNFRYVSGNDPTMKITYCET
jgi:hypothetical protein